MTSRVPVIALMVTHVHNHVAISVTVIYYVPISKGKTPVKIIFGIVCLIIGLLLGHSHPQTCMDPNTNTPIDCSLVK